MGEDRFSGSLLSAVKTGLQHLLNTTVAKYAKEICNGCIISRPSQRQHPCLTVNEDPLFLAVHFEEIKDRLFSPSFIPAVQLLLSSHHVKAKDATIKIIALTLLHEMKMEKQIFNHIFEMYENLDSAQLKTLELLSERFSACFFTS